MRRALDLAREGRFTVSPNPRVGCVIVKPAQDSNTPQYKIIGEGYHLRKGLPHAERVALDNCTESPQGATMYLNLEPCCHTGATPPCTEAILAAGIKRVVTAIADPFPEVAGKGIEWLRKQGIKVDVGILEDEARYENRFFLHFHKTGLPWVIVKAAMSLDGKLSTVSGESKWITGEEARSHVHEIRAEVDAVLAGIGTVLKDNPHLTARPKFAGKREYSPPTRLILDPLGQIPLHSHLFQSIKESPLWIFTSKEIPDKTRQEIESNDARVLIVDNDGEKLDLDQILQILASENMMSVMIEGGGHVHSSFLEEKLVNEMAAYIAPVLIGGKNAPTFYMGKGVGTIKEAPRLERVNRRLLGPDTLIRGILNWK